MRASGMRIRTASVRRYIDNLKESISCRNVKFMHGFHWLATFMSSSGRALFLTAFVIVAFVVHFAALQFGFLMILAFCTLELACYRLANAFLRFAGI